MKRTEKKFDCIAMKRRGAKAVRARLKEMTREEKLRYWTKQTRRLQERQAADHSSPSSAAS